MPYMISLGDSCMACIIDHIHTYPSFASLPSEICQSLLLLLKDKDVPFTPSLLLKFGSSFLSSLDLSKEDLLPSSLALLSASPSVSTLSTLSLAYSSATDDDILLLSPFSLLSSLNLAHCDSVEGKTLGESVRNLHYLNLRGCTSLCGEALRSIVNMSPNLQTLILSKCTQLTDGDLEPLSELRHLTTLKINHCDKITTSGIECIAKISSLRVLSASHCSELYHPGSCIALGDLRNLHYLDLSYCNITDHSFPPSTLLSLSSLEHLEMIMNKISPQFVESISVSLPNLKVLELGQSGNLTKDDILCLNRLPYLDTMHMSNGRRDRLRISIDQATLKSFPIPISSNTELVEGTARQLATIPTAIPIFPGDLNKPIVLLGEDEQFQARLVKTVLERKNFIVQIAPDGITAYNMYRQEYKKFALVMMDIFLPRMDGLQSIRLIRKFEAENKSKHVPVIICSGNSNMKTKQSNYLEESGGDLFIPKPFPKSLVGLIISMTTTKG